MEESPNQERKTNNFDDENIFSESSEMLMDLHMVSVVALPPNNENNIDMNNANNANLSKVTGKSGIIASSSHTPNWQANGNDTVNGFSCN